MNLQIFNQQNLFDATIDFFKQLNINFYVLTKLSVDHKSILKDYAKNDALLDKISELYYMSMISDGIFGDNPSTASIDEALSEKNEYIGIILFAIEMKEKPSRNEISELTRAFNKINKVRLVALLFRYKHEGNSLISLAISERFKGTSKN